MNKHFEFKDWELAFEGYYNQKVKNKSCCLVISTHWVTSGYWVEHRAKSDEFSKVYRSVRSVKSLESKVRTARNNTKGLSLGKLIL